jgi:MFS transporter, DHA2 family, multidrug resistance protein
LSPWCRRLALPNARDLVSSGWWASAAGLVFLTYGLIQAAEDGWGSVRAVTLMVSGVVLLVGFFAWEHWLTRRPGGQPLLDLTLFGSASFTWGVILSMFPIVAMLGILFTMPQFFQGVLAMTAMGLGLRLLPLVGGLVLGAVPAARVVRLVGAKVAVTAGFVVLALGLFLGSTMNDGSSGLFVAVWMAVAGLGTGISMATAMSAALVELSEEKSGVGSGVMQAVNKTGGPLGIAILGSVLSAGYLARLDLGGLPPAAAAAVRQSVFGGVAVAHQLHSIALITAVHRAFVHGMDLALLVSAGIALVGALFTVLCLPRTNISTKPVQPGIDTPDEGVGQPLTTTHAA